MRNELCDELPREVFRAHDCLCPPARFQWQGAESSIHGSRDNISTTPIDGSPEAGGHYAVDPAGDGDGGTSPRLRTSAFRLMYLLSDVEPGGGALRVIPGSHKREVPWQPTGAPLGPNGNTRFEDLTREQRENFVELTGKAGTVVIFTHDIIHTSWHETDTYRRVVHSLCMVVSHLWLWGSPICDFVFRSLFENIRLHYRRCTAPSAPAPRSRHRLARAMRSGWSTCSVTACGSRCHWVLTKTTLKRRLAVAAKPRPS